MRADILKPNTVGFLRLPHPLAAKTPFSLAHFSKDAACFAIVSEAPDIRIVYRVMLGALAFSTAVSNCTRRDAVYDRPYNARPTSGRLALFKRNGVTHRDHPRAHFPLV